MINRTNRATSHGDPVDVRRRYVLQQDVGIEDGQITRRGVNPSYPQLELVAQHLEPARLLSYFGLDQLSRSERLLV
jgi:hypothetical protein